MTIKRTFSKNHVMLSLLTAVKYFTWNYESSWSPNAASVTNRHDTFDSRRQVFNKKLSLKEFESLANGARILSRKRRKHVEWSYSKISKDMMFQSWQFFGTTCTILDFCSDSSGQFHAFSFSAFPPMRPCAHIFLSWVYRIKLGVNILTGSSQSQLTVSVHVQWSMAKTQYSAASGRQVKQSEQKY